MGKVNGIEHDKQALCLESHVRASKHDCDKCPIRAKCCTTDQARKIPRDLHEDARDVARRKMKTKANKRCVG
jgi:hypothetical protein